LTMYILFRYSLILCSAVVLPDGADECDSVECSPQGFSLLQLVSPGANNPNHIDRISAEKEWVHCAPQWQQCQCHGQIRWGAEKGWINISSTGQPVKCSPDALGDPAPGEDKHCECAVSLAAINHVNPGARINAQSIQDPIASCDIFSAGAQAGPWGKALWRAVAGVCGSTDPSLPQSRTSEIPGPRAMDLKTSQRLMRAWLDPRFRQNYDRFFDSDGWVNQSFVNYVGSSPTGGKYAKMNEQLIRSVHLFSSRPIVVVHFGMAAPPEWDPEQFPNLVLLHAAPMHSEHSFNFNKFRAMLLARARTTVMLDSDQFVAPGVDAIFGRTEEEVTQAYPFPILPVHFLQSKGPAEGGVWWPRFCDGSRCDGQTMRWGHAHPTTTFWALPFLGRWLQRHFQDVTLTTPGERHSLRVMDVPEDEDLLNLGLWEEGGTKQWCKFDTPGVSDFDGLLNNHAYDIAPDTRFYPDGAAIVFYTAHHATDPDVSERYITQLGARQAAGDLPPPIQFHGKFYKDGAELHADHPRLSCII